MPRLRAVAFDVGDTLIPTQPIMEQSAHSAALTMKELGFINDSNELVQAFFRADSEVEFPHINHFFSDPIIVERAWVAVQRAVSRTSLSSQTVGAAFLAYYRDGLRKAIIPSDNMLSLFANLRRRGLKLGIISNGSLAEQVEVLTRLQLLPHLDDVLISEEVGIEKPDVEIFRLAAERLKVEPSEMLYVGNSWYEDVLGASAAGLQVTLYDPDGSEDSARQALSGVDFSTVRDLKEVLMRLR